MKKEIIVLLFLDLILLSSFSVYFNQREKQQKTETLKNFALGLAPSVWNIFEETPAIFLEDYIIRENHSSISIIHNGGSSFIEINNDTVDWSFFPERRISEKIFFSEREIATISTVYRSEIIKPITITVSLLFLTNLIHLLIRGLQKRNLRLEKTVEELNTSNQALVNSETKLAVNNLIVGLSHEINTPLGTITTATSFLSEELENKSLERKDLKSGLRLISMSEQKIKVIMNRIKLLEVQENQMEFTVIDLKKISSVIFQQHKHRYNLPEDLKIWDGPDEVIIRSNLEVWNKILTELIDNACHYGSQSDGFTIRCNVSNNNLKLQIITKGINIDKKNISSIFHPFYSTKREEAVHIGMGLHLVSNLVEKVLRGLFYLEKSDDPVIFTIEIPGAV